MLPYYEQVTKGTLRELLERNKEGMEVFSSLGLQWVCEGDMLYHTLFLSTEEVEQGYGMFRTQMLGDTSHLYCAGEPVSHMGYFAEILQERPL